MRVLSNWWKRWPEIRRWQKALGILVLVLLGTMVLRMVRGSPQPVAVVQAQEMIQTVVATATVQSRHRASMGVQVSGWVREVKVQEGDRIQAGQILLKLDDQEATAAVKASELSVAQAELKWRSWEQVQAPVARQNEQQAQANLAQAQAQLARQQDLFRQNFIGQAALDEALRSFRVAEAQARSATAQSSAHVEGGIEQQLARSALVQAQANLNAARARLSYTQLVAPFSGLVVSRNVEPADAVQPGKALLVLAPDGVTELVSMIDERHLASLKEGQPAWASADAFPGHRFAARISRIAPGVDAQMGAVQVKLAVQEPPAFLRQDMTVSVEIEVARKPQALVLPLDAVHDTDTAHPWVWGLDENSQAQPWPVTLGVRSGARVEVLSGVQVGSRVVAVAALGLKAGRRVRARQLQP